jgi:hypothetical protein
VLKRFCHLNKSLVCQQNEIRDEDLENEVMPENEEQEEKRLTKRTHQMLSPEIVYWNRSHFGSMLSRFFSLYK